MIYITQITQITGWKNVTGDLRAQITSWKNVTGDLCAQITSWKNVTGDLCAQITSWENVTGDLCAQITCWKNVTGDLCAQITCWKNVTGDLCAQITAAQIMIYLCHRSMHRSTDEKKSVSYVCFVSTPPFCFLVMICDTLPPPPSPAEEVARPQCDFAIQYTRVSIGVARLNM